MSLMQILQSLATFGLTNLTSLSFKKSNAISASGLRALASLVNLTILDMEMCSGIHVTLKISYSKQGDSHTQIHKGIDLDPTI